MRRERERRHPARARARRAPWAWAALPGAALLLLLLPAPSRALDCAGLAGDVHPDGFGDGAVDLRDWTLARRKAFLGDPATVEHDTRCGDVDLGALLCRPDVGAPRWCPDGTGAFDLTDVVALRPVAAGLLETSCEPCEGTLPEPDGAALRVAGDVAPRADGGDGLVDIRDVVLALRWAVGLDGPPADGEELLRADVVPAGGDGGLRVVTGDGLVNVADLVALLRASVALDVLAWPERTLRLELLDAVSPVAFGAAVTGWPPWAVVSGLTGAACEEDGGSGVDAVAGGFALACASDPDPLVGPVTLAVVRYRAPEPVDPGSLVVSSQLVDGGLALVDAAVALEPGDPGTEPGPDAVPDFLLVDTNTTSATHGLDVSPRDFLGQASAWYFGHST